MINTLYIYIYQDLKDNIKNINIININNYYKNDEYFDVYYQDTFKIGTNERFLKNVFFTLNKRELKLSFNKRESILAYVSISIILSESIIENVLLNNKQIKINFDIKNLYNFLEVVKEENEINIKNLNDEIIKEYSYSLLFNTEKKYTRNQSINIGLNNFFQKNIIL